MRAAFPGRRTGILSVPLRTITIDLSTSPVSSSRVSSSVAPSAAAHAVCRVEVEPTREDRQPHEQGLLGFGEQPVGPVDRRGEALLPGRRTARAAAQKTQPVQAPGHVKAAHHTHPRRGQLDRQRQAVEPPTDLGDRADRFVGRGRSPAGRPWPGRRTTWWRPRRPAAGPSRIRSPSMPSASRLVASTDTRGQCRTIWSSNRAAASRTCSQLSTTSSSSRVRRYSITVASMPRPCCCCNRRARRDGMAHRGAVVERREFAEPHAVAEAVLLAPGGLEGEPGLADAADAGQRDQRALAQGGGNAQHLVLAPDEAGRAPRQSRRAGRLDRRPYGAGLSNTRSGSPSRICWCTSAQRRARIDAQLVDEPFAHLPVGVERVGLPAAAVLGEHQLPGQAFVQRMGLQCRGELPEQLGVSSCAERGVVAIQCDGKPLGLKGGADVVHPRGVERGERLATPQVERAVEQGCRVARVGGRPGLGRQVRGNGAGRPTTHPSSARSRPARGRSRTSSASASNVRSRER